MRSNFQLGTVIVGASTLALVFGCSLPALAQSGTPITDQYGFDSATPDGATWLESINEQYGFVAETPVTDQYGTEVATWAEEIRGTYAIGPYPTPVSDESGGTGSSPDSAAWYERMKEEYSIGLSV
ncbi:MAG: hypothetical protein HC827_06790 [Cyanobacteria bacterium RM1_2_2]|nr:hypothetical protein [Cyanobacteria bacterium RM1_2_2]